MDRRAALKKISVGGVVVVGASAIMWSLAFAFDSPVVTAPPDFVPRNDTIVFFNRRRVFRIGIASFGAATCTGSSDQTVGGAEFVTITLANGTVAIGRLFLTANVAAGTVVFPPWAFFVGEIKGTPFRDDDWQVGDELTWTLEVPWRCTYGAVARHVMSSTTKTYRVTVIELDPIDFEPIGVIWTEV